jgi:hypothetical protein
VIHFDDPVTQAQYDRLRSEPCMQRGMLAHNLFSIEKRVRWFRRTKRTHWRCTECSLDVVRVKGVCMTSCAGMCSWPKCLGEDR